MQQQLAEVRAATDEFEPLAAPAAARTAAPAASVRRSAVDAVRNVDRFAPVPARFVRFTVLATNNSEPCIDELEIWSAGPEPRNVALASAGARATASSLLPNYPKHRIEHLNDGLHGNDHSWISNEVGAGWVEIELPQTVVIDQVVWGRDREGQFRDRVPTRYRVEVATEPSALVTVADAADRQDQGGAAPVAAGLSPERAAALLQLHAKADQLAAQLARLAPQQVYAGTFTAPAATHRLQRGDPMDEREAIAPGAVAAVLPPLALSPDLPDQQRRLALAQWLGSEQNPLTARVMA
ncbi:MAG TPA: hypothetical protein VK348_14840, partial [Planctomycetota bacterium]|nr:hypothetical protein [Planctomycetota bacterium]